MSRRIEIELTSARPDGTWTWRAAGAREPRGVLDGGLLHEGAKVGEVLRAEADFELEGIVIVSVYAPKTDHRTESPRIEVVGPGRPEAPGVTTQLVGRGDRRPGDRRGERRPQRDRVGRPQGGPQGRPDREPSPRGGGRGERRPDGAGEGGRPAPDREGRHRAAPSGQDAGRGARREAGRDAERRGAPRTSSTSERSRARRLNPGSTHRRAVMDSLPPEQQAVAEQLLRGGIPAVRTALHLEREKAIAEGRPAPNSDQLLAMAESLLPRLRTAEWRDRAEAAVGQIDSISLRDLRSVVAGADQARDDETRALGAQLREGLERRVAKLHGDWAADIVAQLEAGRVVRAVRLSGRAPDPSARLDPELTARLTEAASAMLSPETSSELWASLLEALAESPIRRSVTPSGLPTDAPPELKRAAHQLSGTIPSLAKMLGVTIPPPPAPLPGRRRGGEPPRPARPARPAGGPGRAPQAPGAEESTKAAAEPTEPGDSATPTRSATPADSATPAEEAPAVEAQPADTQPADTQGSDAATPDVPATGTEESTSS